MSQSVYKQVQKKIIFVTLLVSFTPLLILGATIYYQFAKVYKEKVEDQIKYRAKLQSDALEVFLRERTSMLYAIMDTHNVDYLTQPENLSYIVRVLNQRAGGVVDMGIIDDTGKHLAYAGPYDLKGVNYLHQPWFSEAMLRGKYISDVFMGFRQSPHFVIAVRGEEKARSFIIRATIDPDEFDRLVRTAQTGRSGDAFIISREGFYQTSPRFQGTILEESNLDPKRFPEGGIVTEKLKINGKMRYYAGSWLKNNQWLLVISQEAEIEMGGLFQTRLLGIVIVAAGLLAIIVTTILTSHMTVKQLEDADNRAAELNARLIQSDKLAALGKMATGIAHEINNPLAVIGEKAGWMKDLLAEEEFQHSENMKEFATSIAKIEEHVERARKITHNMLGFARRMEPRLDDVDVNRVLDQTVELLENHARINNIKIRKVFSPDLPVIANDQSQLQQVFLNLLNNAIDAIEKDGWIEIKTANEEAQIVIRITDNGPGISEENLKKVFDPFYTTKKTGKGTGLGLSIIYGIVENMKGSIKLESKEGEGTTAIVKLPIVIPGKK